MESGEGGDYVTQKAPRWRVGGGPAVGGAWDHVRGRGRAMAESAPGPRVGTGTGTGAGGDRSGAELAQGPDPRAGGGPSSGKTAIPGATALRSPRTSLPRDAPGEGSDGDSETPTSSVTPSEEEEEEEEKESGHQWRVGDACSAAWSGDGRRYPARLRALDPAAGTCVVEFDGYGNTEERALGDLLPPHPGTCGGSDPPAGETPPSSWELPPGARRRRRRKGEQASGSPRPPEVMPPPWPPAPPHALWEEEEEEEDALAMMLMAWYMSGYHTGFYVGLQKGQAEAAEPPPQDGPPAEAAPAQLGGGSWIQPPLCSAPTLPSLAEGGVFPPGGSWLQGWGEQPSSTPAGSASEPCSGERGLQHPLCVRVPPPFVPSFGIKLFVRPVCQPVCAVPGGGALGSASTAPG
ncbi:uncharacterized protein LOC141916425 [Strix aluco]|uniref:uncharacterized protein LOC141916425 n=1 Tax=Strix aluco TaxID=111821 RepID=UPI003DA1FD49